MLLWAWPRWIAGFFNKFTPLTDAALRERIDALLARCDFHARSVYVMDGSKRSAHGNAYFTGLGREPRIVFYDTLLQSLSPVQVEAVLAHELAHFKLRHIPQRLVVGAIIALAGFALLGWLSAQAWFYAALGVPTPSDAAALLLFMLVVPTFTWMVSPLLAAWSRRHEYEADAKEFDLKDTKGVLVSDGTPKSPAEKAGLKIGDVILEFNGKQVTTSRNLKLAVAQTKPGQTVPVKILRDGERETVDVAIKPLPGSEEIAKANHPDAEDEGTLNGVAVTDLDNRARHQFNVPGGVRGAIITEVQPDSPAAEAGLRPGDVIQEINRKPVRNAEEAVAMTEKSESKRSLLRVWRDGGSRFVVVDESKAG